MFTWITDPKATALSYTNPIEPTMAIGRCSWTSN